MVKKSYLSIVKNIITRPIKRGINKVKKYVWKQLIFIFSIFVGVVFMLFALADYLIEVLPNTSRYIVLFCMGVLAIIVGFIQKLIPWHKQ